MVIVMILVMIKSDKTCAACAAGVICFFVHYWHVQRPQTQFTRVTCSLYVKQLNFLLSTRQVLRAENTQPLVIISLNMSKFSLSK